MVDNSVNNPENKRPIDPKRVLKILEFKREILAYVESMLEPVITTDKLKSGEKVICRRDYDDIVQERHLLKICGFPLCPTRLTKEWKQKYHLSSSRKCIYDVDEMKLFCSIKCMQSSRKYRDDNLSEQPIWLSFLNETSSSEQRTADVAGNRKYPS